MKTDNRPNFRSAAKVRAYEFLEQQLQTAQRKLRTNTFNLQSIAREQRQLKADIGDLQRVIWEFKK